MHLYYELLQKSCSTLVKIIIVLSAVIGYHESVYILQAGNTALHLAATGGHSQIVSQLIRDGANVNTTNGQEL